VDAGGTLEGLLDLVFPRRCVVCRAPGGWLCEACAGDLRPLPDVRCPRCGAPPGSRTRSGRRVPGAALGIAAPACRECAGRELAFASASAAFCYEGPARALVTACKFRALRSMVDDMARRAEPSFAVTVGRSGVGAANGGVVDRVTAAGVRAMAAGGIVVTSVPAHRDHRLERGFDLAESLARRLARGAGLTYAPLLRRVRHGARQSGLERAARAANVHHAFALKEDGFGVGIRPKRVVIVDDVYTTGETLNQCAEALAHASPAPLVFTFARTVRATPAHSSREQAVQKERCR
jgi:predicted amidophosphoribosyltransferase